MIKKINEGIHYNKETNTYDIDFMNDEEKDIIKLNLPEIYETLFSGNAYLFGYTFDDTSSRQERTTFINWIKGLSENKPTNRQYQELIARPLRELDKRVGLKEFKLFVYPRSNRSLLVQKIIDVCSSMMQRNIEDISIELLKRIPKEISFDWASFKRQFEGTEHDFEQIYRYVENELLPKIHSLEYFSIAQSVKPKYRKFIKDFLITDSGFSLDLINLIHSDKILVVDDVNTSGATLEEIIRIIRSVNTEAEIYIFTLIGK